MSCITTDKEYAEFLSEQKRLLAEARRFLRSGRYNDFNLKMDELDGLVDSFILQRVSRRRLISKINAIFRSVGAEPCDFSDFTTVEIKVLALWFDIDIAANQ